MPADSIRFAGTAAVSGASDRLLATGFLAVGALIVYLVLFDQGAAAAVLFGSTAGNENVLHELFHDGRHLARRSLPLGPRAWRGRDCRSLLAPHRFWVTCPFPVSARGGAEGGLVMALRQRPTR